MFTQSTQRPMVGTMPLPVSGKSARLGGLPVAANTVGDSVQFGKSKQKNAQGRGKLASRLLAVILPVMAASTGCASLPGQIKDPATDPHTPSATPKTGGNLPSSTPTSSSTPLDTEGLIEPSDAPSLPPEEGTPPPEEPLPSATPTSTPTPTPQDPLPSASETPTPTPTPVPVDPGGETPIETPDARSQSFAVIGDSGDGSRTQYAVANRLNQLYGKTPFANLLMLGDNVYQNGEPRLFRDRLYKPYKGLFDQKVKVLPVLGNHDVRAGHGDKQLKYWGVPRYYSTKIGPDGPGGMEMFAIDTTVMLPGEQGCYTKNPGRAKKIAKAQMKWLENALANSNAEYKVVYGHYPIYSSGLHGVKDAKPTAKLRSILEPVFKKHGVDLYLAGHEHNYERTADIGGVEYIVSGGGGAEVRPVQPANKVKYPRTKAFSKPHAMLFTLTADGLKYSVYGTQGTVMDKGTISG